MRALSPTARTIRSVLDSLARAESEDNDTKENIYDRELSRIRALDRANILDAVVSAIGTNPKRSKYASHVIAELSDAPGIEKVFEDLIASSDSDGRNVIIQAIRMHQMRSLIGVLNKHFEREADDFCRYQLLHTLASLADTSSLPIFVYLMNKTDRRDEWVILCAAKNYIRPEFEAYLRSVFESEASQKSHKVIAAWGLAKLGDERAYKYLISMLDDPETTIRIGMTTTYDPGESIRATQAICDINGWEFEWSKTSATAVKQRLPNSSSNKI